MRLSTHRVLYSTLIKVDVDGVLRNWNASLIREFKRVYPEAQVEYPFKDFQIAPSFPLWANSKEFYLYDVPYSIYRDADPYVGAVEFIQTLTKRYPNVWLVTTQYKNTMFPTIEWIEAWMPATSVPVVFSKDKGAVGRDKFENTILIDDAPHNLNSEAACGGLAYCFGQLYNFNHPDSHRWTSFFGSTDFSLMSEPARVMIQFNDILQALVNEFKRLRDV